MEAALNVEEEIMCNEGVRDTDELRRLTGAINIKAMRAHSVRPRGSAFQPGRTRRAARLLAHVGKRLRSA